jgi:hypothetical protein
LDTLMRDAATWAVPIFMGIVAVWFVIGWLLGRVDERRGAVLALLGAGGALLTNPPLAAPASVCGAPQYRPRARVA